MTDPLEVHVMLPDGDQLRAGFLRFHHGRRAESSTFAYDEAYLADPRAYALDPDLPTSVGALHTPVGRSLFGAMSDGSPDRWGRGLMRRAERDRALTAGQQPRTLMDADHLLGVHDLLRQGALRYREVDGEFLSPADHGVPRIVDLGRLLALTDQLVTDGVSDVDLRDLVDAGGSLGGARPKAAVLGKDGALMIAKFPRKGSDEWDVIGWEKLTLDMAADVGVTVPRTALIRVADRHVLLLDRFDRDGARRIGNISAMTLLGSTDGDTRGFSFPEIGEELERQSVAPTADLAQLYRRAMFGLVVLNTDNHLRNHSLLRESTGWTLSPAFDMNPDPVSGARFATSVALGGNGFDSVTDHIEHAHLYRLTRDDAVQVLHECLDAAATWRQRAQRLDLPARDIAVMTAAFESTLVDEGRGIVAAHRTRSR